MDKLRSWFSDPECHKFAQMIERCHPVSVDITKLEFVRRMKGLTVKELADKAGVSTTAIYCIEKRIVKRSRMDTIQLLAEALDCAVDNIMD